MNVRAIQRQVHRTLWQPVYRRRARCARGLHPRQRKHQLQRVSGNKWQFDNLFTHNRCRYIGGLGLENLATAGYHDLLARTPRFEHRVDRRNLPGIDPYILGYGGLKVWSHHGYCVGSNGHRGDGPPALSIGSGLKLSLGVARGDDLGFRHERAFRVGHYASQPAGSRDLCERCR